MYLIPINRLEGIDLILKALRSQAFHSNCQASSDLADGIERKLLQVAEDGQIVLVVPPPVMHINNQGLLVPAKQPNAVIDLSEKKKKQRGQRPTLKVVK